MEQGTSKRLQPTSQATEARGPEKRGTGVSGKTPGVRTASKQQFDKAHRKTTVQHAGLFRRLAK
jgi:hypothetical protein